MDKGYITLMCVRINGGLHINQLEKFNRQIRNNIATVYVLMIDRKPYQRICLDELSVNPQYLLYNIFELSYIILILLV